MNEKVNELIELMSDFSEELWCAGWLEGCEYLFWHWLTAGDGRSEWLEIAAMKQVSDEIGGWAHWPEDSHGIPVGGSPVFVPMAEWLEIYQNWRMVREKIMHPCEVNDAR